MYEEDHIVDCSVNSKVNYKLRLVPVASLPSLTGKW